MLITPICQDFNNSLPIAQQPYLDRPSKLSPESSVVLLREPGRRRAGLPDHPFSKGRPGSRARCFCRKSAAMRISSAAQAAPLWDRHWVPPSDKNLSIYRRDSGNAIEATDEVNRMLRAALHPLKTPLRQQVMLRALSVTSVSPSHPVLKSFPRNLRNQKTACCHEASHALLRCNPGSSPPIAYVKTKRAPDHFTVEITTAH